MLPIEVSVDEVRRRWAAGEIQLLDCREPLEFQTARIEGAPLIPMREIPARISELEPQKTGRIVVHCHHGGRSLRVAHWLRQHGFEKARSMAGGIDQWSLEIDPSVPRY